jgi:hypothetical protein
MPIPTAKLAQKRAKLRTKLDGTSITLRWTTWPNGRPADDPTTGATPVTDADPGKLPVEKTATVRAFVHFIQPITTTYRKYAEVEAGDAIVDFPLDLLTITDAGDTAFAVGDVVDELAFAAANRSATESATATDVDPEDMLNLSFEFAGRRWAQKKIGEELAQNWHALYADLNINRAMLVTKV